MPDTTLQAIAQALLDSDVEQGHATPDTPQWGRYEVLAGVALETLRKCKRNRQTSTFETVMRSVLEEKA